MKAPIFIGESGLTEPITDIRGLDAVDALPGLRPRDRGDPRHAGRPLAVCQGTAPAPPPAGGAARHLSRSRSVQLAANGPRRPLGSL
jgi:hypothetical protein